MERKMLAGGAVVGIVLGLVLAPLAAAGTWIILMFSDGQGGLRGSQSGAGAISCNVGTVELETTDGRGNPMTLNSTQMDHAAVVMQAGTQAGVGKRGQQVALMTVLQESTLRNLANPVVPESMGLPNDGQASDHDSVGLFQQRVSMGWGTTAELMDPATSAQRFYERLQTVEGWELMGLGQAAQKVQISAFPDAYDKWESTAGQIMAALSGVQCSSSGGGGPAVGIQGGRAAIVNYSMAQVGKPYIWAAEGPDAFDCSGLTMRAYEQAGIQLDHSSSSQRSAGQHISAAEAQPGDLLWWPGHVAIYTGNGRMVGAQSPGEGVREMEVYGSPTYIRVSGLD